MIRRLTVVLFAASGTALAHPLSAQPPHAFTLDATIGGGYGRGGGERVNRNLVSADAVLAWRLRPVGGGSLFAGLTGAWQGNVGDDAVCRLGADGRCVPDYPSLTSVGALIVWRVARHNSDRGASARVSIGPGYFRADGGEALGLQARVDLATPAPFRIALVASARGSVLPSFRGDALTVGTLGFGVRVQ